MSKYLGRLIAVVTYAVYIEGFLVHLWTAVLAYHSNGFMRALTSFFSPILSELYWVYRQFASNGFRSPYIQGVTVFAAIFLLRMALVKWNALLETRRNAVKIKSETI